jgi:hypothetical protein
MDNMPICYHLPTREKCLEEINCYWESGEVMPCRYVTSIELPEPEPDPDPDSGPEPSPRPSPSPNPSPNPIITPRINTINVTGTLDEIGGLSPENYIRDSNFTRVGRNREEDEIITDIPFINTRNKYTALAIFGILFVIFLLVLSCYFSGPPCSVR